MVAVASIFIAVFDVLLPGAAILHCIARGGAIA
jgi:hypothetical protein